MLKVAVCGGSGYAGAELLRLLTHHPSVKVTAVTSERSAGKRVTDLFPALHQYSHIVYRSLAWEKLVSKADLFFLALPHATSQDAVEFFYRNGKKVIDLSADFRLHDPEVYEHWYGVEHNYLKTLKKAVYGLPELHRRKIEKTDIVANPGCYPTGAILGLYPVIKHGIVNTNNIVIDSKSGTTGAGRKSNVAFSFCEVNEGFKAYGLASHRHTPEIEQELSLIAKKTVTVNFTPHLLPVDRGILTTIYAPLTKKTDTASVLNAFNKTYASEPFVRVLDEGKFPDIKNIRGTNYCLIGVKVNERTRTAIIVTVIDNLVKGAAGQAIHNMNLMMGYKETEGLQQTPLSP